MEQGYSQATELLYFGEDGRLYINHECELCKSYPLEDLNEPCFACGYSQAELLELKRNVDNINEAYDFFNIYKKDSDSFSKGAFLRVSSIKIGQGLDSITLHDPEHSGRIRGMADLVDKYCYVIFYYDKNEEVEDDLFFDDEY